MLPPRICVKYRSSATRGLWITAMKMAQCKQTMSVRNKLHHTINSFKFYTETLQEFKAYSESSSWQVPCFSSNMIVQGLTGAYERLLRFITLISLSWTTHHTDQTWLFWFTSLPEIERTSERASLLVRRSQDSGEGVVPSTARSSIVTDTWSYPDAGRKCVDRVFRGNYVQFQNKVQENIRFCFNKISVPVTENRHYFSGSIRIIS
jgi:hypothetical protein